jgi:hypothetical protein
MNSGGGERGASGMVQPAGPKQSAIFLCDREGLEMCLQKQLVGTDRDFGKRVNTDDLVYLYNVDDRRIYGVWKAAGDPGHFDCSAWGQRNPIQIKVRSASGMLVRIPRPRLKSVLTAPKGRILSDVEADELSRVIRSVTPPRRGSPRDLLLVKWSARAVILVFVLLVILVLWGLATHEPSQFPLDTGD